MKFSHDPKIKTPHIESALQEYLSEKSPKPWFNPFKAIDAHVVRGRPWLEDLQRWPSKKLRIQFLPTSPGTEPAELPEETLYTLFRTYGKLGDITPQPTGSKDLPKYATLNYGSIRDAIMAKNCMHGFVSHFLSYYGLKIPVLKTPTAVPIAIVDMSVNADYDFVRFSQSLRAEERMVLC